MIASPTVRRFLAAALLLAAVFPTSSCVSRSSRYRGETDYLEGLMVNRPQRQKPAYTPMEDTFSYWDDDGTGGSPRIHIDVGEQAAFFYRGDHLVGRCHISTGDDDHPTPTGNFKVIMKDADHKSSVYGWMLDSEGNVVNDNADVRIHRIPPGGKFDPAKMTWFLQFYPAIGMHAGYLPGYPASHGCVRLPEWMARHFFENASVGTPVLVTR